MGLIADRRGSVPILFALSSTLIMCAAGAGIDYYRAENLRVELQELLDAAVLGGMRESSGQLRRARTIFDTYVKNGGLSFEPTDLKPNFYLVDSSRLEGVVAASAPTTLLRVIGKKTIAMNLVSRATKAPADKVCVLIKSQTASAFIVNSGAEIDAPACEFHVQSTAANAAILNSAATVDVGQLCVESTSIINNGAMVSSVETDCRTNPDPYENALIEPDSSVCDQTSLNFNGGNVTLNPGVYCGGINFNGAPNVSFRPGLYVIKSGSWNVSGGSWQGNGVTFYFVDNSRIQFNSAVDADLSAPTVGDFAGFVIAEKQGLPRSQFVFDDSRGMDLDGIVYLPSRDVTFNSGSQLEDKSLSLVVNTLILDQTNWRLSPPSSARNSNSANLVYLER